eukprot:CAMPEP_0179328876 /NCGR_PEP_ID=MMETSP0797-20121207/62797_1 /TAXON_ID=47934 /ORGANISM="Dinophysis acuminata, Strain DAEP01" /LENGTH=56 /DNA_ID=CAMNT_0021041433 /DNA_START=27 /DNA_END=193 /DNA_ORIENTATION=+
MAHGVPSACPPVPWQNSRGGGLLLPQHNPRVPPAEGPHRQREVVGVLHHPPVAAGA